MPITWGVREAVRSLRTKQGRSARSVSLQAGLSPSYVAKVESGQIEPSVRAFGKVARALDASPMEIWLTVIAESLRDEDQDARLEAVS